MIWVDVCREHPQVVRSRLVAVVVGGKIASERRGRLVGGGGDRFGLGIEKKM